MNGLVADTQGNQEAVSDGDRLANMASLIASNYIAGERNVARAILVGYGEEQATLALGSLSIGEFAWLKLRSIWAKAYRIARALGDGSFPRRAKRVIVGRLAQRNSPR